MKNDFDRIAPIYDWLAKMIFGSNLDDIQQYFLDHLFLNAKVLIVGGGTGKILEWLPRDKHLSVTYVELSRRMMEQAQKRRSNALNTEFYQTDVFDFDGRFDYIIANFFLVCYGKQDLMMVIGHLQTLLNDEGKLIVSDFVLNDNPKDKMILRLMHWFFRIISNLDSNELKDLRSSIIRSGFIETNFHKNENGQLFTGVYGKHLS